MELTPNLDVKVLQQKADEAAMNGAIKAIEEFYTGYKSPYIEAITENLKTKSIDHSFNLPDIVANINDALSVEIDRIANESLAKSFLPLVKKILTRAPAEIKLSNLMSEFIEKVGFRREDHHLDDLSYELEDDSKNFRYIILSFNGRDYKLGLSRFKDDKGWGIFSLPSFTSTEKKMTLYSGDAKIEMPFTPNILHDEFISYVATLAMGETVIEFDVNDFNEDMLPGHDGCHCD